MSLLEVRSRVDPQELPCDTEPDTFELPRAEDVLFDSKIIERLQRASEITDWHQQEPEHVPKVGTLQRVGFTTRAGYSYAGIIGQPYAPESSVPVIGTSAWLTSTEGHNERLVRNFVRAGNPVFFVGAEGSFRPNKPTFPTEKISLALSAAVVLRFASRAAESYDQTAELQAEQSLLMGESRGAMVGMGVVALATHFENKVLMADLAAPCVPKRFSADDVRGIVEQIRSEPIGVARLLKKLAFKRLVHYPSTLDLHPYSLLHQIATGPVLLSGEAGELAKKTDPDSLMHVTTFTKDGTSMETVWRSIFSNHPNTRITPLPGAHLTLADPETLSYVIGRNKAAQIALAGGKALTPQNVFDAAHNLAPGQQPAA